MKSCLDFSKNLFFLSVNREGTKTTPAHRFNDFIIRSYAPVAFRHFRELFNIKPDEFLVNIFRDCFQYKNSFLFRIV
jgi:hypothetical protein